MKLESIKQWVPEYSSKAEKIKKIQEKGFKIPNTFVLTVPFQKTVDVNQLKEMIIALLSQDKTYAVRSSSYGEDSEEKSYAGSFQTFLQVKRDDVAQRALDVLDSYNNTPSLSHSFHLVLIQEMIVPEFAGVLFTVDPITNSQALNVEYVAGLGEQLVQEGLEPMRAKMFKGQFALGDTCQDSHKIWLKKLAKDMKKMKRVFGDHLDLEWAYDGHEIYWLQVRPITTKSSQSIYDNKIAKNYLPGLTKPLVYDLNIPLVNGAWLQIFEEIIGEISITPEDLAKSFHYRTYFNMGILGELFKLVGFREDFLEKLQGINDPKLEIKFKPTKTLVLNGFKALMFYRRSQKNLNDISPLMATYHKKSLELKNTIDSAKTIDQLESILTQVINHNKIGAYQKIVLPLLNIANQRKYQNYLKEKELTLGFSYYSEENADFSPNDYLTKMTKNQSTQDLDADFSVKFGHFSENNNDFSQPVWQEQPEIIRAMITSAMESKTADKDSSLKTPTLPSKIVKMKRKADYGIYQTNQLTYYYNYSYHLFRLLFLRWGDLLVAKGKLHHASDIFFLNLDHLISTEDLAKSREPLVDIACQEKSTYERAKDYYLPERIIGDEDSFITTEKTSQTLFNGVPMAPGRVKGQAFIPKSLEDLSSVKPHHIVILDHSDMSYEPFLRKARAVLMESGGVLSHIGITARELGIPAITSLSGIIQVAPDTLLAVDGYSGEVYLMNE